MSPRRPRLDKIEDSLTPTQAIVLWMDEAHQFPLITDYAKSLVDKSDSVYPLDRLIRQVETAALKAVKGMPRAGKDPAVERAVRDVVFLFYVHNGANEKFQRDWRALHLEVAALVSGSSQRRKQRRGREHWWDLAANTLVELYSYREMMEILSRTYFAEHPVLFPAAADGLTFCIETAEGIIENHNGEIEFSGDGLSAGEHEDLLLNVEAVKRVGQQFARGMAAGITVLARGKALELLGHPEQAVATVRQHLQARSAAGAV